MEWVKFLTFSFGFGGLMLVVFVGLVWWLFKVHLPNLEKTRESAFKDTVSDLRSCLAEERESCRKERVEREARFVEALRAEVQDRKEARHELSTALDRLQQSLVALAAEFRALSAAFPQ